MSNISDYLDWRSDIPFSFDPFNEVDNLVLCELVYVAFEGIVSGPSLKEKITIEQASQAYFEKYSEEEILARTSMTRLAPFILKKMAGSKRYGGMKLAGYVNEVDAKSQSQFAVCTFYLPDKSIFVAFRGTDDTLIGWREDYDMSFSCGTAGQLKAVEYLNNNFSRTMKDIRVGGHSKGGNFAVYASAFCRHSVKDNIIEVYSNDGPGFVDEIINTDKYQTILPRIKGFIPQQSIVGMLMANSFSNKIVVSDAKGIMQHDPLSWQVLGNEFVTAPELDPFSIMFDEMVKKWVMGYDYETRSLFGDILFSAMKSSGATKLSQVTGGGIRSIAAIVKDIQALDSDKQAIFMEIIVKLMSTGGSVFADNFLEIISKSLNRKK